MGTHVADTPIVRSRDHGRSWDTEPKSFAVALVANIESLTMACCPVGYELFVADTEGTVHMSGRAATAGPASALSSAALPRAATPHSSAARLCRTPGAAAH